MILKKLRAILGALTDLLNKGRERKWWSLKR